MSDIHIDDFYKDVALTFLRLYNSFPRKTILYTEDICGEDEPDEFGLHSERFTAGFSTMVWLGEQGYLKYDAPIKQEALDQAVLTERGFLLLSSRSALNFGDPVIGETKASDIPSSVMEQSKTNINQLRKAIKSQSSIMISQAVRYMLDAN
ncbi:hypothetical protein BST96_18380 [Oceanicoccus sagamiensis]|uniref:Uncharacterized protein n=2 Tax=Oceanicoccus sagamiensis TaxID=716816 RepID=A0A1X9NPT1_9GAMM|nr:hypothetical protein BST96_18380 [Oceanicoccus sagamiensis]